jgi:hypothetical protein
MAHNNGFRAFSTACPKQAKAIFSSRNRAAIEATPGLKKL